jgi:hypothetical protein
MRMYVINVNRLSDLGAPSSCVVKETKHDQMRIHTSGSGSGSGHSSGMNAPNNAPPVSGSGGKDNTHNNNNNSGNNDNDHDDNRRGLSDVDLGGVRGDDYVLYYTHIGMRVSPLLLSYHISYRIHMLMALTCANA